MKVLVTGATGFIGNYIIKELLKKNIEVIASSTSIEKAKAKPWFKKVIYVEHDIKNCSDNLFQTFHSPDALIHLAWRGLPYYKQLFHIEEELMTQYFFLKKLIEGGVKNVTIAGTCFEYGMQEGCLKEDINLSFPSNNYSIVKDTLRKFLVQLNETHSFSLKWLRLFYMHGKGQNEKSILPQLQKALANNEPIFNMSGGEQVRDYLSVEKLANYIVESSLQTDVDGIINISSNEPIKIIDLIKQYLLKTKQTISLNLGFYPYPDYEPFAFWGDNTKLKKIISKNESN
jgi:nucleoside-diphosphate-sugar epimerase